MKENRILGYIELIGGALIVKPLLSAFKVETSEIITQYLLGFAIAYIVIEELKIVKEKIDKYVSNKIKETLKKERKSKTQKVIETILGVIAAIIGIAVITAIVVFILKALFS